MLSGWLMWGALAAPAQADATSDWQGTLDEVVPSVVSIRSDFPRSFDTQGASNSQATGFVVDAERGLMVTNRHVVGPGPSVLEAVFSNNEEVPLRLVYRDPVHDFAIVQFDPAAVRFMDVAALDLCADCASVGLDVRVVGNDAGEKISILPGTIARLDRNAPTYGVGRYNDFNTFYFQSASGTSGGSSGSPVLDIEGRVVALNAGGRNRAASSYFLPLDRVVRTLAQIQQGEAVPRGTLQTTLRHKTYDEVRRLGLGDEAEATHRAAFTGSSGMLVVTEVIPDGPADGRLRPGDVLLSVDGAPLADFDVLEQRLDASVGESVVLGVSRGGADQSVEVPVGDLHAITPSDWLEFGRGILLPLSYQKARGRAAPVQGAVVASAGYTFARAGIPVESILLQIDGVDTPDLDAVEAALAAQPDGARVPVRFTSLRDLARTQVRVITIDRTWFPMQRCRFDDASGEWPCAPSAAPPTAPAPERSTATPLPAAKGPAAVLAPSLVEVDFDVPFRTEGVYGTDFRGTGIIVDTDEGLVIADRDTVPISMGDATLTFGGSLEVPAEVVWLHPVHNLAVLRYDPSRVDPAAVQAAELAPRELSSGDAIWQVGLDGRGRVLGRKTEVARVQPLVLPLPSPPFFRDRNIEIIQPQGSAPSMGGALTDKKGRVVALWASFADLSGDSPSARFEGLPADLIVEALDALRAGAADPWPSAGFEMVTLSLAEARHLGLDDAAAAELAAASDARHAIVVSRITEGAPARAVLQEGDVLLRVGDEPVVRFSQVEEALRGPAALTILRSGVTMPVILDPHSLSGRGVERLVGFAGTLLHAPHDALATQRGLEPVGVYTAWYWYGSPAARFGLRPTRRIMAVNGQPTPDLDAFLAAVAGLPDRAPVRLDTLALDGQEQVVTLKLDQRYWPTFELSRAADGTWTRAPR